MSRDLVAFQEAVDRAHRAVADAKAAMAEVERLGGAVTLYGSPTSTNLIHGSDSLRLRVTAEF